jgi:hypothetical protein
VLGYIIEASIDAARSIRSSTGRNGIMCLRAILRNCKPSNYNIYVVDIFTTLFNRIGTGPRFMSELATSVVSESTPLLSIESALDALEPVVTHKNAEASSRAFTIMARRCNSSVGWKDKEIEEKEEKPKDIENDNESKNVNGLSTSARILHLLSRGLDCRLAEGREACKKCILNIYKRASKATFQNALLESGISEGRKSAVRHLVEQSSGATGNLKHKHRINRTDLKAAKKRHLVTSKDENMRVGTEDSNAIQGIVVVTAGMEKGVGVKSGSVLGLGLGTGMEQASSKKSGDWCVDIFQR